MKYINELLNTIKNMDKKILKMMKDGFRISFLILLLGTYLLTGYQLSGASNLFYIGFSIFKSALCFGVAFFIFAIAFNTIKKEAL